MVKRYNKRVSVIACIMLLYLGCKLNFTDGYKQHTHIKLLDKYHYERFRPDNKWYNKLNFKNKVKFLW